MGPAASDDRSARGVTLIAAAAGCSGVALGAFGSHGLEDFLASRGMEPETIAKRLPQFDTAVRYHLVHAVGLLALAGTPGKMSGRCRRQVAGLMAAGLILFCGSLYLLVLTDTPWLGAITPLGGVSWLIGWAWLGVSAWRET